MARRLLLQKNPELRFLLVLFVLFAFGTTSKSNCVRQRYESCKYDILCSPFTNCPYSSIDQNLFPPWIWQTIDCPTTPSYQSNSPGPRALPLKRVARLP